MAITPSDLSRAEEAPFSASGGHRIFVADTSPDSITLAAGAHELFNAGSELAYIRLGSAVSVPSDKAAEVSAQAVVPAGGALSIALASETVLHALTASSSTTLHVVRKAVLT